MQVLELQSKQNTLLKIAHDSCRWVVCEDRAIDKELLNADDNRRIIGFTTGEGCFGEYNVTVSARYDLLEDIKKMLKQRLIGKFTNWSMTRADASAEYCVKLTESFDGSRILKALNPYDYEIHNFLAYALTVKILGIDQPDNGKYVLRSLINLDNYQHWFKNDETRPDFMLIEIPNNANTTENGKPLDITIRIIECKMSVNVEGYYDEAFRQVSTALSSFSQYWNDNNNGIDRRYWFTQLYRAIVFSKLSLDDNDPKYTIINSKIYNILSGEFNISWLGEVFAFDLKGNNDNTELKNDGNFDINIHTFGQISIQKMLLPREDGEIVKYVEIDQDTDSDEEEEESIVSDNVSSTSYIDSSKQINISYTISVSDDETLDTNYNSANIETTAIVENKEHDIIDINSKEDKTTKPETVITNKSEEISEKKNVSDIRIWLGNDMKNGEKIYWEFGNKNLNNRHLLINGNSGCGKTYCIQGLLMSAARQGISSVVFDYTGGFTNSKLDTVFKQELSDRIEQRIVKAVKIPINPFKKGDIQIDEDIFVPEEDIDVASKIAEIMTSVYKFGDQQKSAVYSAVLNGLRAYGDTMNFQKLAAELEALDNNYSKTVLSKIQPFIDMNPFAADDNFGWDNIRDSEKGIVYVMQLAGYNRDVQVLLTELMLWDIWSFCTKTGDETKPFILVMDEAQNLDHGEKSPSAKILTEGRKFGISGWYATQFMKPQLSDDEIQRLQSGQKLYFCPPDDGVDTVAKNLDTTPQGKKDWAARLKKLRKGECVTSGSMIRNDKWTVYPPKVIKVPSMQERLDNE
jgi:DNA replication protein DnaC